MTMLLDPNSYGYFDVDGAQHTYTYNGPNGAIDTDTVTNGANSWRKTYTYTGLNLTGESAWVKQ